MVRKPLHFEVRPFHFALSSREPCAEIDFDAVALEVLVDPEVPSLRSLKTTLIFFSCGSPRFVLTLSVRHKM
jgi:hypothetical protein